ncbi:MAG: exo-alpha-sialidase [Planctomycetes bacterium]|nr:exo-alpha-sialidase [Planctomycetota bacterium]
MAWKWDAVLYDQEDHVCGIGRRIWKLENEKLAIRVGARREQGTFISDFGCDERGQSWILCSKDGGLNWKPGEPALPDETETVLPDGTRISVVMGSERSAEENRAVLAAAGRDPSVFSNRGDYWPASKKEELLKKGYVVFDAFKGTVLTETALDCQRSFDGGKTYERKRIEGLPPMGRRIETFRTLLSLRDGTLLTACWGHRKGGTDGTGTFSFALRSTDRGGSWQLIPIGEDPAGRRDFDETDILELPDGGILAMMRSYEQPGRRKAYLHQSLSRDGGLTWSVPERTPIWGYPPQLTLLSSGAVHCVYAHRRYPFGIRACLSHDNGRSWDIENEIIVRDDAMTGRVGYPTAVQVTDGTILTAYAIERIPRMPYSKEDRVTWGPGRDSGGDIFIRAWHRDPQTQGNVGGCHQFAGISRYTPDYVRPRGQVSSRVRVFVDGTDPTD